MSDRERHPMMPPPRNPRDALRNKASEFFKEKEKRSAAVFEQMQTERVVSDAKTAKLRALRLARDEAERSAGEPEAAVVKEKKPIVFNIK